MKYGLSEKQLEEIIARIGTYREVETAVLFGSRAIDTFKEASDVDIALKGEQVTASLAAKLKFDFEEDSYLPFFFDFIAYPTITNDALRRHIDEKGIVIYRRGMGEWRIFKLGDIVEIKYGKDHKGLSDGAVPAYGTGGIMRYVEKSIFNEESILIPRKGSLNNIYYINKPFWTVDTLFWTKINHKIVFAKYLFYQLKAVDFSAMNVGSAVPSLTASLLNEVETLIPPLPEQKAIAAVLSSLDDKIDLLYRQNKTLEAMAETLFRQWFVVEARGDWEEKPLSGIANFLNGLACQKFPPQNDIEKLPVLKIKELSSGITDASDWATNNVKPEYIVENGDVIFAWSASLMVKVWDDKRCVLNQHLFKVTSDDFPKWFYLMWCKQHLREFISISSSHATTMGHIKRGDLDTAMVLIPSYEEIVIMSEKMTPLLDKQIAISKQIKTLEKLRDTLLPKLMSGEVRMVC